MINILLYLRTTYTMSLRFKKITEFDNQNKNDYYHDYSNYFRNYCNNSKIPKS